MTKVSLNKHKINYIYELSYSILIIMPEPSTSEVEVAIGKLKSYKSPDADQIPAKLIHAGGKHCILRSINLLN
jgi:hypothetical protein